MDKIKCGLKLWSSNEELFDQAKELFKKKEIDFIEVYVVPGSTNRVIAKLKGSNIPMVIHAPHSSHNFNPGSKDKFEYNLKLFVEIKKVASELNFPKIIIHPEQGDIQQSLACFDKLDYPNILVENMPKKGLQGEELIGYTPQEIKLFLDKGYGFCFDIGHAIKAAYSLKKDLKQFIKEFFKLKPEMFHISGGHNDKEKDEHLNLWEGNIDLKFIKECIQNSENKLVTFETPKENLSSLNGDIKNINYFKEIC